MNEKWKLKFERKLSTVSEGSRNNNLLPLARFGLLAGYKSEELADIIIEALPGARPLERREVLDAIGSVAEAVEEGHPFDGVKKKPGADFKPNVPSVFNKMVKEGRAYIENNELTPMDALYTLSPVGFDRTSPRAQAVAMLNRLAADGGAFRFCCHDQREPRNANSVVSNAEWLQRIEQGEIPNFVMANTLTGKMGRTKDGKPSMGADECVDRRVHAVVEMDEVPLDAQASFWIGVIRSHAPEVANLKPITVTFSGSKSLHGIVRTFTREEFGSGKSAEQVWNEQWAIIRAKVPHVDRNCSNAGRLTRLAGAKRDNGNIQELLYITEA